MPLPQKHLIPYLSKDLITVFLDLARLPGQKASKQPQKFTKCSTSDKKSLTEFPEFLVL
jgi:hypothetical protein